MRCALGCRCKTFLCPKTHAQTRGSMWSAVQYQWFCPWGLVGATPSCTRWEEEFPLSPQLPGFRYRSSVSPSILLRETLFPLHSAADVPVNFWDFCCQLFFVPEYTLWDKIKLTLCACAARFKLYFLAMKRNQDYAATPIPPLNLDVSRHKTFLARKSFGVN